MMETHFSAEYGLPPVPDDAATIMDAVETTHMVNARTRLRTVDLLLHTARLFVDEGDSTWLDLHPLPNTLHPEEATPAERRKYRDRGLLKIPCRYCRAEVSRKNMNRHVKKHCKKSPAQK